MMGFCDGGRSLGCCASMMFESGVFEGVCDFSRNAVVSVILRLLLLLIRIESALLTLTVLPKKRSYKYKYK